MDTPKKPVKKASASTSPAKKGTDKAAAAKPKSRFDDDEDDVDFDEPIDELKNFDHFDRLDEDDDY